MSHTSSTEHICPTCGVDNETLIALAKIRMCGTGEKFLLVAKGEIKFTLNDMTYEMKDGDTLIMHKGHL